MSEYIRCAGCLKPNPESACLCGEHFYCGEDCAQVHWQASHQFDCIAASQKRERDSSISDEDEIILRLSDGEIKVRGKYLKGFQTIEDLVEDAGTDSPLSLSNISKDTMDKLLNLRNGMIRRNGIDPSNDFRAFYGTNGLNTLIDVFFAANYLNGTFFVEYSDGSKAYIMDILGYSIADYMDKDPNFFPLDSGYDVNSKTILEHAYYDYLPDQLNMRLPQYNLVGGKYRIFEIPSNLWIAYILPALKDKPFQLFKLRSKHIGLYRTVSEYILKRAREVFPELQSYADEIVFEAYARLIRGPKGLGGDYYIDYYDIPNRYGIMPKKIPDALRDVRGYNLRGIIILSLEIHKSWESLALFLKKRKEAAAKARDRYNKQKQTKEEKSAKLSLFLKGLGVKNTSWDDGFRFDNVFNSNMRAAYKRLREGPIEDIDDLRNHDMVLIVKEVDRIFKQWIATQKVDLLFAYFNIDKFYEAATIIYQNEKNK